MSRRLPIDDDFDDEHDELEELGYYDDDEDGEPRRRRRGEPRGPSVRESVAVIADAFESLAITARAFVRFYVRSKTRRVRPVAARDPEMRQSAPDPDLAGASLVIGSNVSDSESDHSGNELPEGAMEFLQHGSAGKR